MVKTYAVNCNDAWLQTPGDDLNGSYVKYEDYAELERRLLATEAQKPVAWTEKCEITNMQATGLYLRGFPDNSQGRDIPLYAAAPPLKVPDAEPSSEAMKRALEAFYEGCHVLEEKAMLAAFKILLADVRDQAAQPVAVTDDIPPHVLDAMSDMCDGGFDAQGIWDLCRAALQPSSGALQLPQWIPCSERMPEESGRYWCYVEEQNSLGKSHYQWNCSWNGDVWSDKALTGRVTHWMPLPAAPQETTK